MGRMGMSRADFESCTPLLFTRIVERWREWEQARERRSWEQTRLLATCMVRPYCQRAIAPEELLPLPWDEERESAVKRETESKAELMARYAAARERHGLA